MNFAFSSNAFRRYTLLDTIHILSAMGYQGIEIMAELRSLRAEIRALNPAVAASISANAPAFQPGAPLTCHCAPAAIACAGEIVTVRDAPYIPVIAAVLLKPTVTGCEGGAPYPATVLNPIT